MFTQLARDVRTVVYVWIRYWRLRLLLQLEIGVCVDLISTPNEVVLRVNRDSIPGNDRSGAAVEELECVSADYRVEKRGRGI